MIKHFLGVITRNWLSLLGTSIALVSIVLIITLFAVETVGHEGGPYLGILTFLILPMLMVVGLILIPIGIHRQNKRDHAAEARGEKASRFPVIDLNSEKTRGAILIFLLVTVVNVVVLAGATYKGVEVLDSTEFCGTACHTVMEPEYTAYQRSPHSRVDCADCHIGPGADWFVKSKLSGAWQMIAVTFNLYPTPIPTPIHNLRPARDTCEQCHWPTKFVGDKLTVRPHFEEDETNTELHTIMLLKVGGLHGRESSGIHWHVDPGIQIRYQSDPSRETIYDVELTDEAGNVTIFKGPEEAPADGETVWRTMDCVDCHNRPTHIYRPPNTEIDTALDTGRIDPSLPYVKREGMRVLQARYDSHEAARDGITGEIKSFYAENYPQVAASQAAAVEQAASELGNIYAWNVFPHMQVDWSTYPNHIGHQDTPGCFRCHDNKHRSEDKQRISRKCDTCHTILADGEADPEILKTLNP